MNNLRRSQEPRVRLGFPAQATVLVLVAGVSFAPLTAAPSPLSPVALAVSPDAKSLYIACATANQLALFDIIGSKIRTVVPLPSAPTGLALSADATRLYVTCAAPQSQVCVLDTTTSKVIETLPAGHTATGLVLSRDGRSLYVCNRFNNEVSMIDLERKQEVRRVAVQREPVAAAITRDGKFLLVANHLHNGRAEADYVAAVVSVIDLAAGREIRELQLPHGSGALKDVRTSPDGKHAVVTHIVGRFNRPTTDVYQGWMNANAITVIDVAGLTFRGTVLLDEPESGAANPWGLAWSADGTKLVVAHAGTHEISVIDFPALAAELPIAPAGSGPVEAAGPVTKSKQEAEQANYLPFLTGARERVKLPVTDLGPRAVLVLSNTAYVANYFSDTLSIIDLAHPKAKPQSVPLNPQPLQGKPTSPVDQMTLARKGEFYFHDATICYHGWQSCSSCHPGDGRVDGLNWDLLNDGLDNPKNTKSLLLAHQTPPAMWLSVRETAETAVRAGIKHILFTSQPEEVASAIDAYLKSLKPVPSPRLIGGKLSETARRGENLFSRAGCAECHPPPLFTDLRPYNVGTGRRPFDKPADKFDTPTLVELWRNAPYLHDGSAATVRDVLTIRNPNDDHGKTSNLTSQQIDDLCAYLLSL